jgi:hypothetical protein
MEVIKVTAYDQMYYLSKNKDTYKFVNMTATEIVKKLASDFGLNLGTIEDTQYKIATQTETNAALLDMIQNALDSTMLATGNMYVLFDDAGKLNLRFIGGMHYGFVVDDSRIGDFDYKSSIADNTYNKVKLAYENDETGERQIFIAQDGSHINEWGVLQFFQDVQNPANAAEMANTILKLYNTRTRSLKVKNCLGDIHVRAGTMLVVMLNLGDMSVSNFLLVEQVKHSFANNQHLMELQLRGNTFVA